MKKVKRQNEAKETAKNSSSLLRLGRLIRSLSQAQKRDFKKYVKFWGGQGDRKYLLLYEAMLAFARAGKEEETLTEFLLKKKKFGEKPADLSALAHYLYKKILESMRTTPEGAPHLVRLNALMQDILFVYNKNLLSDCLPLIEEARQMARALDKPAYELELLLWERRTQMLDRHRQHEQFFPLFREEENRLIEELIRFHRFNAMAFEIAYFLRGRAPLPPELDAEIQSMLPQYRDGLPEDLSRRSKVRLGSLLAGYYEMRHSRDSGPAGGLVKMANLEKSLRFQENMLDIYRSNPLFFEEEQAQYAIALEGYINRCLRLGKIEEAEKHIAGMQPGKDGFIFYQSIAFVQLTHHLRQNDFRQARDYIVRHQMAAALEKYKNRINETRMLALRFTCGQVYFCLDDFNRAGDWFGQVASMRPELRADVVWLCKLLDIICLYEQGVYKQEINPTRPLINHSRALRRAGLLNEFLDLLISAVSLVFRNPRALTRDGLPELLVELHRHLSQTQAYYLYGMVLAWLEYRLNRSSIAKEIERYNR